MRNPDSYQKESISLVRWVKDKRAEIQSIWLRIGQEMKDIFMQSVAVAGIHSMMVLQSHMQTL